jgi:hypothetical protein
MGGFKTPELAPHYFRCQAIILTQVHESVKLKVRCVDQKCSSLDKLTDSVRYSEWVYFYCLGKYPSVLSRMDISRPVILLLTKVALRFPQIITMLYNYILTGLEKSPFYGA